MSTTIYEAWRTKEPPDSFLPRVQAAARGQLLRTVYHASLDYLRYSRLEIEEIDRLLADEEARKGWTFDRMMQMGRDFLQQRASLEKNLNDFSVQIYLRFYEGFTYILPSRGIGIQFDFDRLMKRLPLIEPFAYWDNTDPDETVTAEEWEYREEVWNALDKVPVVTLSLLDYYTFSRYEPMFRRGNRRRQLAALPELLRQARFRRQADLVLRDEWDRGRDYCQQKMQELMRQAGDPLNDFWLGAVWKMTEEARERTRKNDEEQKSEEGHG